MRDYEAMIVYDPNLEEAALEAANTRVSGVISQRGGTVQNVEPWGRRRLAYPIGRHRDGTYVLVRFQGEPQVTTDVERSLKLMESVVRFLVVRAVQAPPPPRTQNGMGQPGTVPQSMSATPLGAAAAPQVAAESQAMADSQPAAEPEPASDAAATPAS